MKSLPNFFQFVVPSFATWCCLLFTGLPLASGQTPHGFSEMHFDGTFVILGEHILDTSDLGVLLQETNPNFQKLSKPNGTDLSWDSDGVRYTSDAKRLKIIWIVSTGFLRQVNGHPTHVFKGKLSIFDIKITPDKPVPSALLTKYGFAVTGSQLPRYYRLQQNGWIIDIITDRDRKPEAVSLEHGRSGL
jgi:hypothetical protein